MHVEGLLSEAKQAARGGGTKWHAERAVFQGELQQIMKVHLAKGRQDRRPQDSRAQLLADGVPVRALPRRPRSAEGENVRDGAEVRDADGFLLPQFEAMPTSKPVEDWECGDEMWPIKDKVLEYFLNEAAPRMRTRECGVRNRADFVQVAAPFSALGQSSGALR